MADITLYNKILIQPCNYEIRSAFGLSGYGVAPENFLGRPPGMPWNLLSQLKFPSGGRLVPRSECESPPASSSNLCTYNQNLYYLPRLEGCERPSEFWGNLLGDVVAIHGSLDQPNNEITIILASHHHRMARSILPLKRLIGFANACAIQVKYRVDTWSVASLEVLDAGFPDKKGAHYVNEGTRLTDYIDVKQMTLSRKFAEKNLKRYLTKLPEFINIIVIRHANSLHNQPLKKHSLDNVLSPLGMLQVQIMARRLRKNIKSCMLYGCASSLRRTQHTLLLVLNEIGFLPDNLQNMLNYFNSDAQLTYERLILRQSLIDKLTKEMLHMKSLV